jgi:broad specificity phosphatase PhoE
LRSIKGRIDEPLNEEGLTQAKELANRLSSEAIEVIYSSPLKRALQTVQPLAHTLRIPIIKDSRITEVDFGSLSGKTQEEIEKIIGSTMMDSLSSYDYNFHEFSGESFTNVQTRVAGFIKDLKAENYQTAFIVTHGGIVRTIHYVCTGEKIGYQSNAILLRYTV